MWLPGTALRRFKRTVRPRVHRLLRRRKAAFARREMRRWHARSLLVVGVNPDRDGYNNMIERELAAVIPQCVASGIKHPATPQKIWAYVTADGRRLPFADDAFDVVYANAVIEHVGGEDDQRRFAAEIDRVGRHWIITTPNLCFPLEAHTWVLFRHWSPAWRRRHSSRITRLLTPSAFRAVLPGGTVRGTVVSPTLTAVSH